jgi:hypothetical protein
MEKGLKGLKWQNFLFLLVAGCLFLYDSAFSFFHARLAEEEKKTMAWLTEQLSYTLPFILICVFHGMVYWKHDRRDGIAQSEMMWQVILVTGLTYCALLPYIFSVSEALHTNALAAGESFPQTDAKEDLTLILELHQWFIRLSIPLGALILFHGMRASREKRHPETEALEKMMKTAGCATTIEEVHVSPELLEDGLRYHSYMRYRLLIPRILPMLGLDIMYYVD